MTRSANRGLAMRAERVPAGRPGVGLGGGRLAPCRRLGSALLLLLLAAAAGLARAALPVPAQPLIDSRCATGGLVDAVFRDAALATLAGLVVHAPGRSADGAVRSHHSAGHVDAQGRAWHQISAYQVNLGLLGALRVAPASQLPVAAGWLGWLARHIAPGGASRGVVLDHWVRAGDFEESTCPPGLAPQQCEAVDAFDSTAATTLLLADAYLQRGGDVMLIRAPGMRAVLEAAATTLQALTVTDGMTLAKPSHPVVYTMDVVEVIAGWRAWGRVQQAAYAQPQSAINSFAVAAAAEAGLRKRLWHAPSAAWRVHLEAAAPQRSRWYPDTVAQAWPLLWGVDAGPPGRAAEAWRQAIAPWQRNPHWARSTADPEGFLWPAVAVAALCTGDEAAARTWVARARQQWLDTKPIFAWPFQVGDLLWLLWLSEPQTHPSTRAASLPQVFSAQASRSRLDDQP